MGILSKLLGGGIIKTVESVANVADDYVFTDEERAAVQKSIDDGQLKINMAEAQHRSIFVAGWRPFIGWVCGFGLIYSFLIVPVLDVCFKYFGAEVQLENDRTSLMTLTTALLGLGGMRTYEKIKGASK